jgi:spheroidene monooxygenase
MSVTSLSLFRFDGVFPRISVVALMALSRMTMARDSRLRFWKLCGSGTDQGFTPKPNWGVWAILAVWNDESAARQGICDSRVWARWRKSSAEDWTVFLRPTSARGSWSGTNPFLPDATESNENPADTDLADAPHSDTLGLAALTRATLRPRRALRFWRRVPDISAAIGADPNVAFKIGIGEMPLLHQATFSIWPDAEAMARFARGSGPHGAAIRAVREGDWFSEELYARFAVIGQTGTWDGGDPLARLATRPALLHERTPA